MKLLHVFALSCAIISAVAALDGDAAAHTTRILSGSDYEVPKAKPKPPPSTDGGSSSSGGSGESESGGGSSSGGGGGSSGGSGGGGGSSGGSGGSSGGSGGGGGSSGGSGGSGGSSGGNGGGGGGSSSGGGGGSSGGGGDHGSATYHAKEMPRKSHAGVLGLAAAAMVAGAIVAVAASRRKTVVEEPKHTLAGSVNRRMALFSHMAKHSANAIRPPRRVGSTDEDSATYKLQNDTIAAVV